ncbi:MAG: A24 family peptidase [Coxiellaceae bacterium]|jgi:leader peptidase (prepilin peptidase)/N-methyltransferase|nr:A24 family peptidase [Coxiellaceae bacterium]
MDINFVFTIACIAFGLIIGSFLNVVIYRLPIILKSDYEKSCFEYFHHQLVTKHQRINLATPPSYCPCCQAAITWWQNIPILSYLILRGKCYHCKKPISLRYLIVEILSCVTTIVVVIHFGIQVKTFPVLILTWMLIAAVFIDLEQQLLPDHITLPLIWLGLLLNTNNIFTSPQNAIVGATAGYLSLLIITKIFKLIRKVNGMGHGDFKLLAVFGAWLGWQFLPIIVLGSSLMGVIVGLALVISKKHRFNQPLAFGPYLAISGWLAFFWGPSVMDCSRYLLLT